MQNPRYALVGYVKSPVGEFVEGLWRELHPNLPHLAAHLTILPPRPLQGSEQSALKILEEICSHAEPLAVELGDVATFLPVTNTIYIRIAQAESSMRSLHDRLNTDSLSFHEALPYTPHLTIGKLNTEQAAREAYHMASERWAKYTGSRGVLLKKLVFVREESPNCWVDLASVTLGTSPISR